MRKLFLTLWLVCFCTPAHADWQSTLEAAGFDIVETFDQLQDWQPAYARGTISDQTNMPKKLDGSPSIWNAYSYWPTVASPSAWIKDHGAANVWQGTGKSMIFDMEMNDTTANLGPGRLKTYFGSDTADQISPYTNSGIEESGYRGDVYIFEMIKLPSDMFPKTDGVNKYYSYFKFHVLATGKTNVDDCTEGRADCEYGASNIHTLFFTGSSYDNKQRFKLEYYSDADWADLNLPVDGFQMWKPTTSVANLDGYIDSEAWFGLEVHVHRGDPGVANGYQEYWLYDSNGTEHYVGRVPADYMMMTASHDWGFNYFFQGGNISFQTDVVAQSLTTTYYVDDIIINDTRIGPTYFGLLGKSATLTGTAITGGVTETELTGDDQTIIITLTDETFVATACENNAATTALLAGFDGTLSGAGSWDDEINWTYADCTRNSDNQLTLVVKVDAFDISADDEVTGTIPGAILTGGNPITASPTITITHLDPPVISGLGPTSDQPCTSDLRTVNIYWSSDESSTCKYDTSNTTYALMSGTASGTLSHTAAVADLDCGTTQTFYVRCTDTSGNVNTSSESFSFDIVANTAHIGSVQTQSGGGSVSNVTGGGSVVTD